VKQIQVTLNSDELIAVLEALRISRNACYEDYQYGHLEEEEAYNYELWEFVSPKFSKALKSINK
jgi:hypothetical protein